MSYRQDLFPPQKFIQVMSPIVRQGKTWVEPGRYKVVRLLDNDRVLVRLREKELTVLRTGSEAYEE